MVKVLNVLLLACIVWVAAPISFSTKTESQPSQTPRIIVEDNNMTYTSVLSSNQQLVNLSEQVNPRIAVEYSSEIYSGQLSGLTYNLTQLTSTTKPRIMIEYSTLLFTTSLIEPSQIPSALIVSLALNSTTTNSGMNVVVQIHVTNGTSVVKDASVQLVSDKGGAFNPQLGYTNSSGDFTATFTAPSVSTQTSVRINVTALKSGYDDGSNYEYLTVYPLGPLPALSVAVTSNPTTIQSSQTSTITTRVIYGGNPITGATVTLSSNEGGTLSTTIGSTDSSGYFTATFTAPTVSVQTTITITANATKTGYLSGQSQTQITVNPIQPQPQQPDLTLWAYIAGVIVVLIVIGGAVAFARRKSNRNKP